MIITDFRGIQLRLDHIEGKPSVFDPIRKKWIVLTPEEQVRQFLIQYLAAQMNYPYRLMAVEKAIAVGKMNKRFDIVVYSRDMNPWMLVECKAPGVPINEKTLFQLLNYHSAIPCRYWLLTNGCETFCADATDPQRIVWMERLPGYDGLVPIATQNLH